jgi:hypothetical protein
MGNRWKVLARRARLVLAHGTAFGLTKFLVVVAGATLLVVGTITASQNDDSTTLLIVGVVLLFLGFLGDHFKSVTWKTPQGTVVLAFAGRKLDDVASQAKANLETIIEHPATPPEMKEQLERVSNQIDEAATVAKSELAVLPVAPDTPVFAGNYVGPLLNRAMGQFKATPKHQVEDTDVRLSLSLTEDLFARFFQPEKGQATSILDVRCDVVSPNGETRSATGVAIFVYASAETTLTWPTDFAQATLESGTYQVTWSIRPSQPFARFSLFPFLDDRSIGWLAVASDEFHFEEPSPASGPVSGPSTVAGR